MEKDARDIKSAPPKRSEHCFVGAEKADDFLRLRGIKSAEDKKLVLSRPPTRRRLVHPAENQEEGDAQPYNGDDDG